MQITIHEIDSIKIAEIRSGEKIINTVSDALDLIMSSSEQDSDDIIICEINFTKDFFDLRSGLAGEILQKFINYRKKIAIIGEFNKYSSKNFQDFVYECNKGKNIFFVTDFETAKKIIIEKQ